MREAPSPAPATAAPAPVGEPVIEIRGLRKTYGEVEAVRGIDLTVARGEVFALLGPNGAGKTTTVEILEGHRERSAGDVSVLGFDPGRGERAFKARIGIVLQETSVDRYLTVAEAIDLFRSYYPSPLPRAQVIDLVGLADQANTRVGKLSGGQMRRLDMALGLAGDPELLFLDEPTTGFDPAARRNAWEVIRNLAGLGKTIFLTTHYMDEAQYLADRVAIIVGGVIVAEGPPGNLAGRDVARTRVRFELSPDSPGLPPSLRERAEIEGGRVTMQLDDPLPVLHELTGWALSQGVELIGLHVAQPSLEDVYLELTGSAAAEDDAPPAPERRRRRRRR